MLSSAEAIGHALMICLGRAVKLLAQSFSLVALTTNHLVGGVTLKDLPLRLATTIGDIFSMPTCTGW